MQSSSPEGDTLAPRLPPVDVRDPVVEYYKQFVDQTLLLENLKLTPAERVRNMESAIAAVEEFRRAGQELRKKHAHGNQQTRPTVG